MTPEAALAEALEHQRSYLLQVLAELQTADRVRPGTSTFWSGLARTSYEWGVNDFTAAVDRAEQAIQFAERATAQAARMAAP